MAVIHSIEIIPAAADIDELGHVNNAVYVRWLQDVGTAHWEKLTTAEQQATHQWVVRRHEIDYLHPSFAGEKLRLTTRCTNPRGARIDRIVELCGPDGKPRLHARTTLVLLDGKTGRPQRVPRRIIELFGAG